MGAATHRCSSDVTGRCLGDDVPVVSRICPLPGMVGRTGRIRRS
ncbi:hypothetical protein PACID_30720 [Acidipropionibacterium acidipropionici ATCC 4875]|uniref:Uncharacterized protein n=1 Tax=Acidipropionibacterium acidipropionici (strain ATCC 4875 / DSM 20272 / JCM 6432 / NBRC 12425 / NCIMB 8070 / 4) TaxID=1171373 RepID=K7SNR8_ACIA4|nr:hypothetical protein PACID_30720 [Acidipropionibacterium acidipropionici ATCC 4875]